MVLVKQNGGVFLLFVVCVVLIARWRSVQHAQLMNHQVRLFDARPF
jgi:hypothetical protein